MFQFNISIILRYVKAADLSNQLRTETIATLSLQTNFAYGFILATIEVSNCILFSVWFENFQYYPSLNRTRCCTKGICTDSYYL